MNSVTMVAIDVEATGLSDIDDEIIEIAAIRFRGNEVLDTFSRLVKPSIPIPHKITRITHIDDDMVFDAPAFADIRTELRAFIGDDVVVGHNVDFDVRMLASSGLRLKQHAVDTFELAMLVVPQAKSFKLGDLASVLSVEMHIEGIAHRALYDAHMTHGLFCRLYELLRTVEPDVLMDVLRLTRNVEGSWALRPVFEEALRDATRNAMTNAKPRVMRSLDDYVPLEPTNSSEQVRPTTIQRIFSPTGPLGRLFPGYEQREPQVVMSQAVASALNSSAHLIVEAGTGTGKGMAYLVPAALHALERGQRVILTTHTINLQDQLFFKDIPALVEIFDAERAAENTHVPDVHLQSALLKGRSNYLCLHRFEQQKMVVGASNDEVRAFLKVAMWANATGSGDRNEISLFDKELLVWERVHAGFDLCNGPGCDFFNQCWFFHARRKAEAAHLVVVNHALLLADMVTESPILPVYDHVIIDEAHNLEDVATDQFGWRIAYDDVESFFQALMHDGGQQQAEGLLSRLPGFLKGSVAGPDVVTRMSAIVQRVTPHIERAREHAKALFGTLLQVCLSEAETNGYDTRLRIVPALRRIPRWVNVSQQWDSTAISFQNIALQLADLQQIVDGLAGAALPDYEALATQSKSLNRFALEFLHQMSIFITGSDANAITWMIHDRNRDVLKLATAPLEVATLLRERLFDQKASVVLTSATMSINGRFDYLQQRLGVDAAERIQLDSPYNYEDQVLLYLPHDIPEPRDDAYQSLLEQAIIDVAVAAEGRTLVLFTATSALRATYQSLADTLAAHDINVLAQGIDGSRKSILERFKSEPRSVLFGTASFWEGVDVVGDALSALIITKLPFAVPSDPIYAARAEHFVDPFNEYSLPQSILKFKQGFGRLVRAKEDRGVVVVLDRRLSSKRYGQQFLESLPATQVRTGPLRALSTVIRRMVPALKQS
ncbi:MAG: 3'-5' exoribonuclease [Chloroflexaceae bacterium]|nr:3'-5' exoribonuclease [Chloroflexaceae bacterium]